MDSVFVRAFSASMHMLDAYDDGEAWECLCCNCEIIRNQPKLVDMLWEEVRKKPPNPLTRKTVVVTVDLGSEVS